MSVEQQTMDRWRGWSRSSPTFYHREIASVLTSPHLISAMAAFASLLFAYPMFCRLLSALILSLLWLPAIGVQHKVDNLTRIDDSIDKGIAESGVIRPDAKGRVFLTDQKLSPAEVQDRLFIGRCGEKGSHVVEIQAAEGFAIRQGKNANELMHQGSIRNGRQGILTVKPNE